MTFKMMMNQWVDISTAQDIYFDNFYFLTTFTQDLYYDCQKHLSRQQQLTVACIDL
ncbi:MAG: hypothetical protein GY845_03305 [Planctomycetes bacterium]|nr:hypothetical protein [Planctomycetota bacterium]